MNYSGFNTLTDQYWFAVCYPEGTQDIGGDKFWNVGYLFTAGSNVDDVDFIVSLAQELQTSNNLSSTNTFITGMSNGAELCYLIACESSGTLSAYAPVAGTIFTNGLSQMNLAMVILLQFLKFMELTTMFLIFLETPMTNFGDLILE